MSWDPDQYNRFKEQRMAPFRDLVGWLRVRPQLQVVDLGCGTGELTQRLADLLPDSTVVGLDNSAEMLSQSRARPGLAFVLQELETFEGEYDLIFSHAALHWASDHERLFARLWQHLRPGGQLLVQMPTNFDHPSHRIAANLAVTHFGLEARATQVLPPEAYADILYRLGATDIEVMVKVYPHVLADGQAIVEWTKGTLLTAYLPQLRPAEQGEFLKLYGQEIGALYPEQPVFYGFKRLLLGATRPA